MRIGTIAFVLLAVSASAAGAALAQDPSSPAGASPPPASSTAPADNSTDPSAPAQATQAPPASSQSPAGPVVEHVTNGPVPDTPDNRARYGAPMSNGGQTTAPAGN
jgi:hypothetical protein